MIRTAAGFYLLICALTSCDADDSGCQKTVNVTLTFWDNTCWGSGIRCGGEWVEVTTDKWGGEFTGFCDNDGITCEEPEVLPLVYTFEWSGETCEYCSNSDDTDVCVSLRPDCDPEFHEITASGSEEEGPHPMWYPDCPQAADGRTR